MIDHKPFGPKLYIYVLSLNDVFDIQCISNPVSLTSDIQVLVQTNILLVNISHKEFL